MNHSFIKDLKKYNKKLFTKDLIAGLTVAVILIPQGMAYSMLAGLPPIYGLYAALVPMIIYPFFSSSRELSVGPVALMSIIILGGVSAFAKPGTQEYIDLVLLTALLSGVLQVVFAGLKLGSLSNFLSRPVMSGFISAAGVIIAISQLKYLFSIKLPRRISIVEMISDTVSHLNEVNIISLIMGLLAIFIIVIAKKIHRAIPSALIVVIIGSVVLKALNLAEKGVPIVGDMPKGLPDFYLGFLDAQKIIMLLPTALVISLVCFVGSYSIAKSIAAKKDNYPITADKELLGLGLAKIVGSFFLAMPSTGSFTRSAINNDAGAETGLSSTIAAIFLALTIAFFGGLFYYLPEPILAAIVITSVFSLIDFKEAKNLFKIDKLDFWVLVITFFSTLFFGIVNGIIIGIVLSLLGYVQRTSKANYAVLGQLPDCDSYRNIKRYSEAKPHKNILIIRFSQGLFFGNSNVVTDSLNTELKNYTDTKGVIISMPIYTIPDSTVTSQIIQLIKICKEKNIRLIFTDLNGPVRDYMHKTNLYREIGASNFHLSISDAINDIKNKFEGINKKTIFTEQTNYQK